MISLTNMGSEMGPLCGPVFLEKGTVTALFVLSTTRGSSHDTNAVAAAELLLGGRRRRAGLIDMKACRIRWREAARMQMQTSLMQTLLWFICSVVEMCGNLSVLRTDCFRPLEQYIFGHPGLLFWVSPAAKKGRILGTIFRAQSVQKRTHFEDQIPGPE